MTLYLFFLFKTALQWEWKSVIGQLACICVLLVLGGFFQPIITRFLPRILAIFTYRLWRVRLLIHHRAKSVPSLFKVYYFV